MPVNREHIASIQSSGNHITDIISCFTNLFARDLNRGLISRSNPICKDVYEKMYQGYATKHWGTEKGELDNDQLRDKFEQEIWNLSLNDPKKLESDLRPVCLQILQEQMRNSPQKMIEFLAANGYHVNVYAESNLKKPINSLAFSLLGLKAPKQVHVNPQTLNIICSIFPPAIKGFVYPIQDEQDKACNQRRELFYRGQMLPPLAIAKPGLAVATAETNSVNQVMNTNNAANNEALQSVVSAAAGIKTRIAATAPVPVTMRSQSARAVSTASIPTASTPAAGIANANKIVPAINNSTNLVKPTIEDNPANIKHSPKRKNLSTPLTIPTALTKRQKLAANGPVQVQQVQNNSQTTENDIQTAETATKTTNANSNSNSNSNQSIADQIRNSIPADASKNLATSAAAKNSLSPEQAMFSMIANKANEFGSSLKAKGGFFKILGFIISMIASLFLMGIQSNMNVENEKTEQDNARASALQMANDKEEKLRLPRPRPEFSFASQTAEAEQSLQARESSASASIASPEVIATSEVDEDLQMRGASIQQFFDNQNSASRKPDHISRPVVEQKADFVSDQQILDNSRNLQTQALLERQQKQQKDERNPKKQREQFKQLGPEQARPEQAKNLQQAHVKRLQTEVAACAAKKFMPNFAMKANANSYGFGLKTQTPRSASKKSPAPKKR